MIIDYLHEKCLRLFYRGYFEQTNSWNKVWELGFYIYIRYIAIYIHIYIYIYICIFMHKKVTYEEKIHAYIKEVLKEVLVVKFSLFVAWKIFAFNCITSCYSCYWECCKNEIFGALFSSRALIISGTSIVSVKPTKDKHGSKHSAISFLKLKAVKGWG